MSHGYTRRREHLRADKPALAPAADALNQRDTRDRPRDYNTVARHHDLLEASIDLALPKIREALTGLEVGAPVWQIAGPLRKSNSRLDRRD
jgi:hypothetical protein